MTGQRIQSAVGALLGQTTMRDMVPVLLTGVALIIAMLGLFVLGAWVRRRFWDGRNERPDTQLSIEGLEKARRQGDLSDEEFSMLRRLALGLPPEGLKKPPHELSSGDQSDDLHKHGDQAGDGGSPRE